MRDATAARAIQMDLAPRRTDPEHAHAVPATGHSRAIAAQGGASQRRNAAAANTCSLRARIERRNPTHPEPSCAAPSCQRASLLYIRIDARRYTGSDSRSAAASLFARKHTHPNSGSACRAPCKPVAKVEARPAHASKPGAALVIVHTRAALLCRRTDRRRLQLTAPTQPCDRPNDHCVAPHPSQCRRAFASRENACSPQRHSCVRDRAPDTTCCHATTTIQPAGCLHAIRRSWTQQTNERAGCAAALSGRPPALVSIRSTPQAR